VLEAEGEHGKMRWSVAPISDAPITSRCGGVIRAADALPKVGGARGDDLEGRKQHGVRDWGDAGRVGK
jgi:hypothetical protein